VIGQGQPVKTVDYGAGETTSRLAFTATAAGFYAVTVEDAAGKTAYTDPIWVAAAALMLRVRVTEVRTP
jgi:hypothetical protein